MLNTILALSGIFVGAFLITKLTHQETPEVPLGKESDGRGKEEKSKIIIEKNIEKFPGLNSRQMEILNMAKHRGVVTPKDLQGLVPGVSSRTLRRDMDVLAKAKYISQKGSTKSTFYKYIGR